LAAITAHVEGRTDHYEVEHRLRTQGGEWRWILTRGQTVRRDESGRALYISGTHTDIHERKQAEATLRQLNTRLDFLLSTSPVTIYTCAATPPYAATFVSANVVEVVGCTAPEFLAKPGFWAENIHPDDRARVFAGLGDLFIHDGHQHEYRFRHLNGGWRWVRDALRVVRGPDGQPVELIGYFIDITAQKEAEIEHGAILETAIDGFWVADREGRLIDVNDAYCQMSGYPRDELLRLRIPDLEAAENSEDTRRHIARIMTAGSDRFESRHRRKDGSVFDVEVSVQFSDLRGGVFVVFLRDITHRRAAETALRESEERYRLLVQGSHDAIMTQHPPTWAMTSCNPAALALFGVANEEAFRALAPADLSPELQPDGRPSAEKAAEMIETALREGSHFFEWMSRRLDGTLFPTTVLLSRLEQNGQRFLQATVRDITVQKQAEAALRDHNARLEHLVTERTGELRESEAKFRAIIESSPVAMAVNDEHGNITFLNRKFIETFGYTLADIPTLAAWWPRGYPDPAYRQRVAQEWQAAVEKAQRDRTELEPMEYQVAGKDGTVRDIRFSMAPMGASNLVIFYDLTERKQAEAALCESEERLRHVLDGLGPQMFAGLLDLQGTVLLANRPALEAAALRSENVLGKPVADTYWWTWSEAVSQRLRAAVERAAQGEPVRYDEQIRVAEGQLIWLDFSIHPLRDETGRIRFLVPSGLVITERKQAEESLRQSSEQLRALTQRLQSAREEEARRIARELHDELGQMLTGLKMDLRWVERDLEEGETDARTNALLEKVVAASELVDGTVKTVQRIAAELRSGLLDKLGLAMALRHESQQFQQRTGVTCRLRVPEPEPRLPAEVATACYRICQEALTNVARHAAATEVEIELRAETGAWLLEIHDNGKGIAAAKLTDPHSLGLIGMQERARHLGGEVSIGPGAEGGTVVRLRIPQAGAKTEDVS
ncbi:MAG: PAS domain S-box protein, partial [Verrucomicrobia bacterium]|nr:PAS domain S-box protein [Verrucomicrobiota bacterium]